MNINDFSPVTPETLRHRTEPELWFIMTASAGGVWDGWARVELARRQHEQLVELMNSLTESTNKVHQEVALLGSSSDRLERLTKTLRNLTWVLIVLTVVMVAEAIVVEVWKSYHESASSPAPSGFPQ